MLFVNMRIGTTIHQKGERERIRRREGQDGGWIEGGRKEKEDREGDRESVYPLFSI